MKIHLKIKTTLLITAFSIAFSACEYHVEEELEVINGGTTTTETEVSFKVNVQPILENKCVSCHNGNRFPDLRTHQSINANSSRIRQQVVNRTMPVGGSLPNSEIELIRNWIDQGALNN